MEPLKVDLEKWPTVATWISMIFFGFSTVASWRDGACGTSLVFLFFIGLCLFVLFFFLGSIEMNTEFIRQKTILGIWQINWDEVKTLEIAPKKGGGWVLHGENKRLAIVGTELWAEKDKTQVIEFFDAQVKGRGIEIKPTQRAAFQMSKNTKLK